eukprot:gene3666-6481_t
MNNALTSDESIKYALSCPMHWNIIIHNINPETTSKIQYMKEIENLKIGNMESSP